jgi:hypothetical protein
MRAARGLEPTSTALSTDLAWLYPPNVDLHTTDRLVLDRRQISMCGMLRSIAPTGHDHVAPYDSKDITICFTIVCQGTP